MDYIPPAAPPPPPLAPHGHSPGGMPGMGPEMQQMQEQFGQMHMDQHHDLHPQHAGPFANQARPIVVEIDPQYRPLNVNGQGQTVYEGYILTRAADPQGLPLSWSRAVRVPMSTSQELLAAKAKEQATGKLSAAKRLVNDKDMTVNQRKQVEMLIATKNDHEADDRFEWKLAYLDSTKKTKQTWRIKIRETVSMEVVLKRVPKFAQFFDRQDGIHHGLQQPLSVGHAGPHMGPPYPGSPSYGPPISGSVPPPPPPPPPHGQPHGHSPYGLPPPPPPPLPYGPPHSQSPYGPPPPEHPFSDHHEDHQFTFDELEEDILMSEHNRTAPKKAEKKKGKEAKKGAPKGHSRHNQHLPSSPKQKRKDAFEEWTDFSDSKYSEGSDSEDFDFDNKTVLGLDEQNSSTSSRGPEFDRNRHRRSSHNHKGFKSSHREHRRFSSPPRYMPRERRLRDLDEEYFIFPKKRIVESIFRDAATSGLRQGPIREMERPPLSHAYTYDTFETQRGMRRDSGIGLTRRSSDVVPRRIDYDYFDEMERERERDWEVRERELEFREREKSGAGDSGARWSRSRSQIL